MSEAPRLCTLVELAARSRPGDIHTVLYAHKDKSRSAYLYLYDHTSWHRGDWFAARGEFYVVIYYKYRAEREVLTFGPKLAAGGEVHIGCTHRSVITTPWTAAHPLLIWDYSLSSVRSTAETSLLDNDVTAAQDNDQISQSRSPAQQEIYHAEVPEVMAPPADNAESQASRETREEDDNDDDDDDKDEQKGLQPSPQETASWQALGPQEGQIGRSNSPASEPWSDNLFYTPPTHLANNSAVPTHPQPSTFHPDNSDAAPTRLNLPTSLDRDANASPSDKSLSSPNAELVRPVIWNTDGSPAVMGYCLSNMKSLPVRTRSDPDMAVKASVSGHVNGQT